MRGALLVFAIAAVACKKSAPAIGPEDAGATVAAEAGADAAPDAAADASDGGDDADTDACVPGDTWDARVVVGKRWDALSQMTLQGSLDLVVPRLGARKTIFPNCGGTGGGCGDCSKPRSSQSITCDLTPSHARIDIGIDEVGPTWVDVVQRGDTIVADWTRGGFLPGGGSTKTTDILLTLPCSVKIRFVR